MRANNSSIQQNFNRTSSSASRSDGVLAAERIESSSQSQSRDCEPSPPTSPSGRNNFNTSISPMSSSIQSSSQRHNSNISMSSPTQYNPYSHNYQTQPQINSTDNNYLITMRRNENGKKETTFAVSSDNTSPPSQITANSGQTHYYNEKPGILNYYNSQRPISPAKSTSNNEMSTQSQNRSIAPGGGPGGMVIYYSPDAGCLPETAKYCSETELQRVREQQQQNKQRSSSGTPDHSFSSSSNATHFVKRPMSFMKALEMTDKIERTDSPQNQLSPRQQQIQRRNDSQSTNSDESRQSQYEMNYEISV
jgi:hypothetical protein